MKTAANLFCAFTVGIFLLSVVVMCLRAAFQHHWIAGVLAVWGIIFLVCAIFGGDDDGLW